MEDVEKNLTKNVFTKKEKNNIINKNYNPLKVNFKLIYESEGLCVRKTKDILLKEVIKEPKFIERVIFKLFNKTFTKVYKEGVRKGFNWNDYVR